MQAARELLDILAIYIVRAHEHAQTAIALHGRNEREVHVEKPSGTLETGLSLSPSEPNLLFTFREVHDATLQDEVVTTDEGYDPGDRAFVFSCAHFCLK